MILIRFMDKIFDIEITDSYGKFVVSLFLRTVSKEFNKFLDSFTTLDTESEVLDVGWQLLF